ncbi:MAG: hypothetical protein LBG61_04725 [Burkholderiales bacterium]|nr:hypothetical protein [Burkholderiales bacterium]
MNKEIPRIAVALKPSRRLARFLLGATLVTLALWGALFIYLPWFVWGAGVMAIVVIAACSWRRTLTHACRHLAMAADGFCELTFDSADSQKIVEGNIASGTFIHAWLVSLHVKDEHKTRALLILPDMMTPDEWRQFRVMARHVNVNGKK